MGGKFERVSVMIGSEKVGARDLKGKTESSIKKSQL
jgi:hypothetical protein